PSYQILTPTEHLCQCTLSQIQHPPVSAMMITACILIPGSWLLPQRGWRRCYSLLNRGSRYPLLPVGTESV
uniref:Uncharacterized protein n=1 Tax=Nothobranchius furzeri TaxID=105023 RepID=A0A8C6PUV9_NOTFU